MKTSTRISTIEGKEKSGRTNIFADTEDDYCDSKFDKKKNSTRSNIS